MIFIITKSVSNFSNKKKSLVVFAFVLFWAFYFFKVLTTQNVAIDGELMRPWFEYIFYGVSYVILPYITFTIIDFHKYKEVMLNGLIFSGFVLGIFALYTYGGTLGSDVGRISYLTYETGEQTLSPLALSYSGSLTMVLCIFKLLVVKGNTKYQRIYLLATLVLSFIMFLLGSSRGSVVALFLSFLVFLAYSPLKTRIQMLASSILAIPVIIWAIEASGSGIISRIENTKEDGGSGRSSIWADTIEHFMDNMVFGGRVEIGREYPHNMILETLMATGLVGSIILFSLLIATFFSSLNLKKGDLFLFQIFIQGLSLSLFSGSLIGSTLLFLPMGAIIVYKAQTRTSDQLIGA
ncbi:O-antigen ligase family protein [Croceivirga thetidis]|nr:O-antigen ligase family protein [Croceivirga thetidis]